MIGQPTNNITNQEIERVKRISNSAETFQAIVKLSKLSVCQNLHLQTEDCNPSCKITDFSTIYKTLKNMADQLEIKEQLELANTENIHTLTPSTSNPSGKPSERTPC